MIYLESTQEFIATNEGKTGVLSIDGETKIGLRYEDVGLIDDTLGLYYTKNNNSIDWSRTVNDIKKDEDELALLAYENNNDVL